MKTKKIRTLQAKANAILISSIFIISTSDLYGRPGQWKPQLDRQGDRSDLNNIRDNARPLNLSGGGRVDNSAPTGSLGRGNAGEGQKEELQLSDKGWNHSRGSNDQVNYFMGGGSLGSGTNVYSTNDGDVAKFQGKANALSPEAKDDLRATYAKAASIDRANGRTDTKAVRIMDAIGETNGEPAQDTKISIFRDKSSGQITVSAVGRSDNSGYIANKSDQNGAPQAAPSTKENPAVAPTAPSQDSVAQAPSEPGTGTQAAPDTTTSGNAPTESTPAQSPDSVAEAPSTETGPGSGKTAALLTSLIPPGTKDNPSTQAPSTNESAAGQQPESTNPPAAAPAAPSDQPAAAPAAPARRAAPRRATRSESRVAQKETPLKRKSRALLNRLSGGTLGNNRNSDTGNKYTMIQKGTQVYAVIQPGAGQFTLEGQTYDASEGIIIQMNGRNNSNGRIAAIHMTPEAKDNPTNNNTLFSVAQNLSNQPGHSRRNHVPEANIAGASGYTIKRSFGGNGGLSVRGTKNKFAQSLLAGLRPQESSMSTQIAEAPSKSSEQQSMSTAPEAPTKQQGAAQPDRMAQADGPKDTVQLRYELVNPDQSSANQSSQNSGQLTLGTYQISTQGEGPQVRTLEYNPARDGGGQPKTLEYVPGRDSGEVVKLNNEPKVTVAPGQQQPRFVAQRLPDKSVKPVQQLSVKQTNKPGVFKLTSQAFKPNTKVTATLQLNNQKTIPLQFKVNKNGVVRVNRNNLQRIHGNKNTQIYSLTFRGVTPLLLQQPKANPNQLAGMDPTL